MAYKQCHAFENELINKLVIEYCIEIGQLHSWVCFDFDVEFGHVGGSERRCIMQMKESDMTGASSSYKWGGYNSLKSGAAKITLRLYRLVLTVLVSAGTRDPRIPYVSTSNTRYFQDHFRSLFAFIDRLHVEADAVR